VYSIRVNIAGYFRSISVAAIVIRFWRNSSTFSFVMAGDPSQVCSGVTISIFGTVNSHPRWYFVTFRREYLGA
jgi:hypothetical protein